jgi:hypothetical protein
LEHRRRIRQGQDAERRGGKMGGKAQADAQAANVVAPGYQRQQGGDRDDHIRARRCRAHGREDEPGHERKGNQGQAAATRHRLPMRRALDRMVENGASPQPLQHNAREPCRAHQHGQRQ